MRHIRLRAILISTLLCLVVLHAPGAVSAAQFRTSYDVDYYLNEKDDNIATRVSFKIKITNLTTDLIVKKFSIMFPKSFQIGNIKASDDFKAIAPEVTDENGNHVISMEFSNPMVGLNMENSFYLDFLQYNLFKVNGNVWEVILPTVENKDERGEYNVKVHLPPNSGKQISISKPKPDHITLSEIEWRNPPGRTIYAVFGKKQNYDLQLRYHLANPKLTRVYTDITFPPDTLYQKVFVESIDPKPANVYMDGDGNFLGRYYLNPKEEKTVYFNGGVEVFPEAREDMKNPVRILFSDEKNHLLSPSTHWDIEPALIPSGLDSIKSIYDHTVKTLSYNYGRLEADITRLGASQAFAYPDQAVCTEYSDMFIAIAREKGMYAREVQGYGFSNDQNLRPLSVNSDILHSWPEYYDTEAQLWVPLDPTWEDTSGIDYFGSFDLNHIVFAVHGKKSDYPYPAGSYKKENDTKDINIKATSKDFTVRDSLEFRTSTVQLPSLNGGSYILKVSVTNTGNTFVWNLPVSAKSDKLAISNPNSVIASLAPYEKKELEFSYKPGSLLADSKAIITIDSNGSQLHRETVSVPTFMPYLIYGLIALSVFVLVAGTVRLLKK